MPVRKYSKRMRSTRRKYTKRSRRQNKRSRRIRNRSRRQYGGMNRTKETNEYRTMYSKKKEEDIEGVCCKGNEIVGTTKNPKK